MERTTGKTIWRSMKRLPMMLAGAILAFACNEPGAAYAKTVYVKAGATGTATGASWANAFPKLQDGMTAANTAGDVIWIAAGAYKPDQGAGITPGDRNATFNMRNNVAIYGGFARNETALTQRDWNKFRTVLSGDLLGNDGPAFINDGENSLHVVSFMSSVMELTALFDGFTITAGNASDYNGAAGGMTLSGTNLVVRNCVFSRNRSGYYRRRRSLHGRD